MRTKHTHVVREIGGIPKGPVQNQRLSQGIDHEDDPENGDGFLSSMERVRERRRFRVDGSVFHGRVEQWREGGD